MITKTRTARQRWLAVHLYLGLALGLLLSVTGISGSLLVFYLDIDRWLNPQLQLTVEQQPRLSYEALFQALRQVEPQRSHAWRIEIPEDPASAVTARYYKPQETEHLGFAPLLLSVNPYNGEVVRKVVWGQSLMTWLYDLHYTLLLDHPGKLLMAIVGGVLVLSLLSGVYLWWPASKKWRTALSFKRHASRQRLVYDLHKVFGIYSLPIMLVLELSGIALEVPEYANPLIDHFSALRPSPKPLSVDSGAARISLDDAVRIGQQVFPDAQLRWIETPDGNTGSYRINLYQPGEPGRRFPKTNVWVDQYSGRILAINNPRSFAAGDTLIGWLHPLHSGEALGLPGRLLVLIAGLICPLLFVTGLLRWLQKRCVNSGKR